MVSKKVFCGAIRPRITGIRERVEPRLSRRSDPWLSAGVETKPGRNLDEVPGAPPNPWRRAPSRDTRDSTVSAHRPPSRWSRLRGGERSRCRLGDRTEGWRDGWRYRGEDGHIYARVCCNATPHQPRPSRAQTLFSLSIGSLLFFPFCLLPRSSDQRLLKSSRLVLNSLYFRHFLCLFHTWKLQNVSVEEHNENTTQVRIGQILKHLYL